MEELSCTGRFAHIIQHWEGLKISLYDHNFDDDDDQTDLRHEELEEEKRRMTMKRCVLCSIIKSKIYCIILY